MKPLYSIFICIAHFPAFCQYFLGLREIDDMQKLSMSMEHPSLVKVTDSDASEFRNKKLSPMWETHVDIVIRYTTLFLLCHFVLFWEWAIG